MAAFSPRLSVCLTLCLAVWIHGLHLTLGKVSDACHGNEGISQAHNILQCENGTEICITEVRYYQYHKNSGCPHEISAPVEQSCCEHNNSSCSWIRNVSDHQTKLQDICSGKSQCDLYSGSAELTAEPCIKPLISAVSSVRSITYTCSATGSCPPPPGSTAAVSATDTTSSIRINHKLVTTPDNGRATAQPGPLPTTTNNHASDMDRSNFTGRNTTGKTMPSNENNDTGAIAGGVVGGVVVAGVAVLALVILLRRRAEKSHAPPAQPGADDVTEVPVVNRPRPAYDNVDSRYSYYQPDRDDNPTAWDRNEQTRISDMYSKVNKTRDRGDNPGTAAFSVAPTTSPNTHGDYDRVQGEGAHFRVHGDYDHVASFDDVQRNSETGVDQDGGNPEADMTYDRLHRGGIVPVQAETDTDVYNALNRGRTNPA